MRITLSWEPWIKRFHKALTKFKLLAEVQNETDSSCDATYGDSCIQRLKTYSKECPVLSV